MVLTVPKTVQVVQLLSIDKVVDIPVVAQRQIPVDRAIHKTIVFPQLHYINKVVDVTLCRSCRYIGKVVDVPRSAGRAGSTGTGRGEDNRVSRSLENR